ncbi:unnamed protein product [Urochloa humidicola]
MVAPCLLTTSPSQSASTIRSSSAAAPVDAPPRLARAQSQQHAGCTCPSGHSFPLSPTHPVVARGHIAERHLQASKISACPLKLNKEFQVHDCFCASSLGGDLLQSSAAVPWERYIYDEIKTCRQ